jgi:ribulose-5-phosphate 4-epimerase/fuculose-1-phosphate aldolase
VTPSGLDCALMNPEDVVLVDLHGKVLEGSFEPSVETPMTPGSTVRDPRWAA